MRGGPRSPPAQPSLPAPRRGAGARGSALGRRGCRRRRGKKPPAQPGLVTLRLGPSLGRRGAGDGSGGLAWKGGGCPCSPFAVSRGRCRVGRARRQVHRQHRGWLWAAALEGRPERASGAGGWEGACAFVILHERRIPGGSASHAARA